MTRREYVNNLIRLCKNNPTEIIWSAKNPNQYMTRTHVLLHYVALKQLGAL